MNPESPDHLIADFIQKGGRVVKLQPPIPITAPEVLNYLGTCGLSVNHAPRGLRLYVCKERLVSRRKLIEVANEYRRMQRLPPFVAKI